MRKAAAITCTLLVAVVLPATAQQRPPAEAAAHRARIDALILSAVDSAKIPGGVLWLEREGKHYHRAYGSRSLVPSRSAMKGSTIFDAASLTKVIATAPSIVILGERGKLKLSDRVRKFVPGFEGDGREDITIQHLLTHTSGLPAILPREPAWRGYRTAIELSVAAVPLEPAGRRFVYSDINYILLGEIVRRCSGKPLDAFAKQNIFRPLGMADTGFVPAASQHWRIAPTTREGTSVLRGIVHDPAARAMGGVAGHAGMFTTAPDLARYARMLVGNGALGSVRVMKPESVQLMTRNHTSRIRHRAQRGLGWDIDSRYSSPRGTGFPKGESFGHTGWTGGSIWIHPQSESFVIFLCNRNHPHERRTIKVLREDLGTLSGEALGLK